MVWGLVCEKLADWPEAERAYRAVIELTPADYYVRSRLAEALLRDGQLEPAASELAASLALDVPRAEFLPMAKQLAQLHQRLGRRAEAISAYAEIAERFPRDVRIISEVAGQLQSLGDVERARGLWSTVQQVARDPEVRFRAQWELAQLDVQAGNDTAALQALTQLLTQVDPQSWRSAELRRLINETLVATQGLEAPVAYWRQQQRDHPDDLTILIELTEALAAADRLDEAIGLYRQAIDRAPSRTELRYGLVDLLVRQGDLAGAVAQMQALAQAHPDDVDVWFRLGQRQLQRADVAVDVAQQQAIASWQRAVELRPRDAGLALRAAELSRAAALAGNAAGNVAGLRPRRPFRRHFVVAKPDCCRPPRRFIVRRCAVNRHHKAWNSGVNSSTG